MSAIKTVARCRGMLQRSNCYWKVGSTPSGSVNISVAVKLLACGARGAGFEHGSRHIDSRHWVSPAVDIIGDIFM